jgi:ABC-type Fe3+ transport system permease subunit
MDLTDGQTIFAIAMTFVMLVVAFAVVVFALWYTGDQREV